MRKGIKILGKVLSAAVLLLIILPLALSLLLDIPAVQNYVVQKAVRMASKKLETTVSIDRVDIGLFSRVKIKGFYVEDYQRDTLLYVGRIDALRSDRRKLPFLGLSGLLIRLTICLMFISPPGVSRR